MRELATPVRGITDLKFVTTIGSGSQDMGKIITQVLDRVDKNNSTVIVESQTLFDEVKFTEGLTIDRRYISLCFIKDQECQVCKLVNPRMLVTNGKIDNIDKIVPLLEKLITSKMPVLMIAKAKDVTGDTLSALVVNKIRGVLDVAVIRAPGFKHKRKVCI